MFKCFVDLFLIIILLICMLQAFLPDMLEQKRGHVVTIASLAGQAGTNKLVDYCASKFACVGLDEALRVETLVQVIPARIFLFS